MTEENPKIDGRSKRAADIALAKRTISRASYDALLAGRIGLQQAKAIGRDDASYDASRATEVQDSGQEAPRSASAGGTQDGADVPQDTPTTGPRLTSRISKDDHTPTKTPCLCGCGRLVGSRFAIGHDMRMFRVAREHLEQGRELTEEQREYLESSGKMQRVRDKIAKEDAKRREQEARKAEREAKAKDAK